MHIAWAVWTVCDRNKVLHLGELVVRQQAGVHVRRLQRHRSGHRRRRAGAVARQHGRAQPQPLDGADLHATGDL